MLTIAAVAILALPAVCSPAATTGRGFQPADPKAWRKSTSASDQQLVNFVLTNAPNGDMAETIRQFDKYSESHGLGMNLGLEKGLAIERAVQEAIANRNWTLEDRNFLAVEESFAVLEVGSHLGDGTLHIFSALNRSITPKVFVASFESNAAWASGCQAVVKHGLGHSRAWHFEAMFVELRTTAKAAAEVLKQFGLERFDLILLDHDHDLYLSDLRDMVDAGVLAAGGLVHADNVGRDRERLAEYLDYVQALGPFSTRFEDISSPYRDRVAISRYQPEGHAMSREL